MGGLLRLAFHDAAGTGSGPNGCIDFTAVNNGGNEASEVALRTVWSAFNNNPGGSEISYADMIVLASNTVIEFASTQSTDADAQSTLEASHSSNSTFSGWAT